jgi:integrase
MTVAYRLRGTKELKNIYIRIYQKNLSIELNTDLTARVEEWDNESQIYIKDDSKKIRLIQMKLNIQKAFNDDFSAGVIIDKEWLKELVKIGLSRPNKEDKLVNHGYTIFLSEFCSHWLKKEAGKWLDCNSQPLDNKAISKKRKALEHFNSFQEKKKLNLRLKDFTHLRIKDFYDYLINEQYAPPTAKKILSEIKTFCKRAKEMQINVCLDFETPSAFKDKTTKCDPIYLNEQEIETIFQYDFSESEQMDIIRDNFILSLWTGKRISDLFNLTADNLVDGFLESVDIKTNTWVKVPLHPQVKFILSKRFGHLPPKVNKDEYNREIKEICRLCGITAMTFGKVKDPDKNRNVLKYYEKYKLVTSHTARRSFATNLSRILSTQDIAKLGGWSNTSTVIHYNKETKSEVAQKAENLFNNQN